MSALFVCVFVYVYVRDLGGGASLLFRSLKTLSQWRYTISITLLLTSFRRPAKPTGSGH